MSLKLSRAQRNVLEHLAQGRDWLSEGTGNRWHVGWLHRQDGDQSTYTGPRVNYQTLLWLYEHKLIRVMSEDEYSKSWLRTRRIARGGMYLITEEGRRALEVAESQPQSDQNWPTHCELCGRKLGKFGKQWAFVGGNALCANGHLPIPKGDDVEPARAR